jgi:2-polyprenyl-3-methyl-5-hydroxy-6-metoxy-1,4-benzoquinol methylase
MAGELEHVYNPVSFLQKVKNLLKPGGIAYIEVPNFKSFGQRISKQYWFSGILHDI